MTSQKTAAEETTRNKVELSCTLKSGSSGVFVLV